jgi:hypothetical protein
MADFSAVMAKITTAASTAISSHAIDARSNGHHPASTSTAAK